MVKPGHYTCGSGSEINCPHFDDVNGCWMGCNNIGDKNCDPPDDENEIPKYYKQVWR